MKKILLAYKPLAKKVDFDSNMMWVELSDGRKFSVPLAYFPRLLWRFGQRLADYRGRAFFLDTDN